MVDETSHEVHQVAVEVGDTIHTKCGCRGLCDAITGGRLHRIDLLEQLDEALPTFVFGRNSFVPESDPLMIRDGKLWTPLGVEEIHRVEKGAAADKLERYAELKAAEEWFKANQIISHERWDELWEEEGDTLRLMRAATKSAETYAQKVAYAAKLAGVELNERQTFIFAALYSAQAVDQQREHALGSLLGSVLGGSLAGFDIAEVLDLGSLFGGVRSPSASGSSEEASAEGAGGSADTEEADASKCH